MIVVFTPSQAALRAKCTEEQINKWIAEGKIETCEVKGNKTNMVLEKSLSKWINRLWFHRQREKMAKCGMGKINIDEWFN